jgi:hypothetical protein
MKRSYEAPKVTVIGNVRELTLAATTGSKLDEDFPDGTPFGDLTFS